MNFKLLVTKFKWKLFWLFRKYSEAKKYINNTDLEHRIVIADVVKSLKVKTLLDVGCGNGSNIFIIQKIINDKNVDFSGIDLSLPEVNLANSRKYIFPKKVRFIQADVLSFFNGNIEKFSCILFDATLMYLTPNELLNVMKKVSNVSENLIIHELTTIGETINTKNGFIHNYNAIFKSLNFHYTEEKSINTDKLWQTYGNLFIVKTTS